jgi:hypothetical protein
MLHKKGVCLRHTGSGNRCGDSRWFRGGRVRALTQAVFANVPVCPCEQTVSVIWIIFPSS